MAEPKKDSGMLMKTLAYGATDESRALLKKYNKPDARDHQDLVICLANLYTSVPDKRELEKELASIHPHKDFILKYNKDNTIEPMTVDQANEELKSNCSGGCPSSNADGKQTIKNVFQDKTVVIVSMVSVVAIVGLYLHYKKK